MSVRTPRQAPSPTPTPPEPPYPWRVGLGLVLAALLLGGVFYGATLLIRSSASSGQGAVAPTETAIAQAVATAAGAPSRTPAPQATTAPQAMPTPVPTTRPVATQAPVAQPTVTAPTGASTAQSAPAAVAATPQRATTVPAPAQSANTAAATGAPSRASTPAAAASQTEPARSATASSTASSVVSDEPLLTAPSPTVPPDVEQAISDAYLNGYWQAKADALYSLDPAPLQAVAAGPELARLQQRIEDDRAQNRATLVKTQHTFAVSWARDGQAQVVDRYVDMSIWIDPTTHQPLPGQAQPSPDSAPVHKVVDNLQVIDGTWKVTDGAEIVDGHTTP